MSELTLTIPKTKTAVKKLLVAERKAMRDKQKQSLFMRRTLSIYNGMKKRATEHSKSLDFDLTQFREWVIRRFENCHYCEIPLTNKTLTVDHYDAISKGGSFSLLNLVGCCRSCNWQKGAMSAIAFKRLLAWMQDNLSTVDAADIKRRLTIGGKWGVRVGQ